MLTLSLQGEAVTDQPDSSSNYCKQHKGQELVLYCETCSETLCRDCVISTTKHANHRFDYIKKYRKRFLDVLDQKRALVDSLSKNVSEIEETRTIMLQEKAVVARDAESEIDRKAIEQKAKVQSRLASVTDGKLASLQTQRDHLSYACTDVMENLQRAQGIVENTADSEFTLVIKAVEQLEEVAKKASDVKQVPTVAPHNIALQMHRDEIHLYSGEPADPSKCTFSRESTEKVQVDESVSIPINVFTSDGKPCLGEQSVTVELHYICEVSVVPLDVQCINPGIYQVDFTPKNRGRHMLAIKVNGNHIFGSPSPMFVHMPYYKLGPPVATITGLKRPGGMLSWNGKILACECKGNRLVEIDRRHQTFREVASVKDGPAGLTADSDVNIYVTTCLDNQLHKLNRHGKHLKVTGKTGSGREEFKMANGVKIFNNKLYVCDSLNHRIKVYDLDLKLLEIIGKEGSKLGQFSKPIDLVFDQAGLMYVTEQLNNRIQVFSDKGVPLNVYQFNDIVTLHVHNNLLYVTHHKDSYVSVITTDGHMRVVSTLGKGYLHRPEEIRTDEDGFVYVTSHGDKVLVF